MKKFFVLLLSMFIVFGVSAQTLTFLHGEDTAYPSYPGMTKFKIAEEKLKRDYPNVKINYIKIDLSDGSTLTMDAMLAAGEAPNVYLDSTVRAGKYMIPEYALPLDGIRDLDRYNKNTLASYTRNGKLYALPAAAGAQAMCINLDIMKEIGYTVPDNWTVDDFLIMAEKVKQKYGGKKWATGMFAGNQSGDYLINAWYATFGVEWYKNSYDKSSVVETGGEKVYEFYQKLVKNEYIPPNSATLVDDDYVIQWASGNLAATAFFPTWCSQYFDSVVKQGLIKKPFEYKFVPFPRSVGVKKVPIYVNGDVCVVHKTRTDIDKIAVRFVEYLNDSDIQTLDVVNYGLLPNRNDVKEQPKDLHIAEVLRVMQENGVQDMGLTDRRFTERRSKQFPILQQVLNLKITPKEAIQKFGKALDSVK